MRTIALVTQKGGSGKSTLALGLTGAALEAGERVTILDTDPQGTVSNWASRRAQQRPEVIRAGNGFELERILRSITRSGDGVAIIDTAAGTDSVLTAAAIRAAEFCLLPSRPCVADIEASHATVRVLQRWAKPFAFVLNQAAPRYNIQEADPLHRLGVLALPLIVLRSFCDELCMSWAEIAQLAADPLVTIGAHTVTHCILKKVGEDAVRSEMRESAAVLEAALGKRPQHFSYPFGDPTSAGPREFAIAGALGFKTAVTTRPGVLFAEHRDHLMALPRVSLNGEYQQRRYVRVLMSGAGTAMWNGFRRVDAA